MLELVLILTDFYPRVTEAPHPAPPRLSALEMLLARARRAALPGGWRVWLAGRYGSSHHAGCSPAQLVAEAWSVPPATPQTQYWLATPVHYFAGLDTLHLHPAGLLTLEPGEQQRLGEEFAGLFGDSPWRLYAQGERELLLAGPALGATGDDPARLLGADPSSGLARGAAAAGLRRLGSEIEMWLHEHPLNRERAARGALALSTLWPWGAERPAVSSASVSDRERDAATRLFGHETVAAALWQLRGRPIEALPEGFATLEAQAAIVLYPTLSSRAGLPEVFGALEQRWIAPALSALRARRLQRLRVVAGERRYDLSWWDLARVWRAPAPWWEALI